MQASEETTRPILGTLTVRTLKFKTEQKWLVTAYVCGMAW
jgi:hypothetical protein